MLRDVGSEKKEVERSGTRGQQICQGKRAAWEITVAGGDMHAHSVGVGVYRPLGWGAG